MLADPDDAPHVSVREMLQNRSQPAWLLVPHMQKLSSIHLSEDQDTCIWTHSADGLFNTRSAYDILRPRGIQRPALAKIWHRLFLRKASMFCWKVIHRVIPVDSRISDHGVCLPSRCSCCTTGHCEDIDHLFMNSDIAAALWRWFSPILHPPNSNNEHFTSWCWRIIQGSNLRSPFGFVALYGMLLIIWEIWKERCKRHYDSKFTSIKTIIDQISLQISHAIHQPVFKTAPSENQLSVLLSLGYKPSIKSIKIKLVRWIPPVYGLCLNVDGASKGNPGLSGGGGCIRDSNGNICLAFAFHYGFGNSLQAEVRALHDGLMLANEFGLSINQIYSDSALLVQSFTNNSSPSWECARWWRPAYDTLRSLQTSCCHVFREANKVADALASYATSNHGNKIFTTFSSLPLACRGPATLDKTGLPYVRLG
ncbi:hypothetical protein Taro_042304 [Colocasia esculenta]|uniref:RNase H type-1 domain-containing protein n=1 Tax=Colocasia esculenta TaxID=4460 RepID=A0A843WZA1_COLES|nr:hypothetical protein [Colocasia esculenta]